MDGAPFQLFTNKDLTPAEFADLMVSVGWGESGSYDAEMVVSSLAAYPFVAHARDATGRLVGYVSAFSDGAFSTFIGELAVRPDFQRVGLGTALLNQVEIRYAGMPIYAHAFLDVQDFFRQRGYRPGERPMTTLFKIPA